MRTKASLGRLNGKTNNLFQTSRSIKSVICQAFYFKIEKVFGYFKPVWFFLSIARSTSDFELIVLDL